MGGGRWRVCLEVPLAASAEASAWCLWDEGRTTVTEISGLPASNGTVDYDAWLSFVGSRPSSSMRPTPPTAGSSRTTRPTSARSTSARRRRTRRDRPVRRRAAGRPGGGAADRGALALRRRAALALRRCAGGRLTSYDDVMTETAVETPTFRNFIAGEWCDSTSGQTFESRNPADTRDVIGRFQQGTKADVAMAVRAAEAAKGDVAADPGAEARRDPLRVRGADGAAQGAARPGDDPRDGQGPVRGARRRPGGHRHRLPDGRRGPPHVRRHDPVRAARQVGDEHPPADRRSPGSSRPGTSRWRSRAGRSCRRS